MSEYEQLLSRLHELRPELGQEQIDGMVKEKKERIGAGYLTDQGALFLIASDLGITLGEPVRTEVGLKDLYIGAKEVSLETRVMSLSPPKQYSRKDGTPFLLRTMTVYDGDSTASVKLWDEKANLPGVADLKPGDLIKIVKAYVKSDLNGMPTINVGSGSSVEAAGGESDIPTIDSITVDAGSVEEGQRDLVVSGAIEGPMSSMHFTNSRGRPGKGLSFRLRGAGGGQVRVVVWGKDEGDLPAVVSPGAKARLLGVRTKASDQGVEIHGNESTLIEVEGSGEMRPITARILSRTEPGTGGALILAVDEKRNLLRFTDASGVASGLEEGDVMECMPAKAFGDSITLDPNSFVQKREDTGAIPDRDGLRTRIADVAAGSSCCIEAIILRIPGRRDIQTKTGESVALSDMYVEDDSGQIWVKGWRDQAREIDGRSLGEIVSITGLNARPGLEGRTELTLTPFSKITSKS